MLNFKWNNDAQAYDGTTSDGRDIRVDGGEFAESAADLGYTPADILNGDAPAEVIRDFSPDMWETCIGANQNVEYRNRK